MDDVTRDFAAWIRHRKHPLICTHIRPDGDAYGSLYGFVLALFEAGFECTGYMSTPLPGRYEGLLNHPPNLLINARPPADCDSVIYLDTASPERADAPHGFAPGKCDLPVANLDHHPDNAGYGDINLIDPESAATAAMLIDILQELGVSLSPETATCLLTGLVMDCGGFRFRNTDPQALRIAARLIEAGGNLHRVMDHMFFQEPLGVLRLKADLLQHAQFACEQRLIYAVMDAERRTTFGVAANETEGVIDILRSVRGTLITCLLQPQGNDVRLSLRGRDPDYPVDEIARTLGGGGHALAAGAELEDTSVAEAKQQLIELVRKVLEK